MSMLFLVSSGARELVSRDLGSLDPELVLWERERNLKVLDAECGSPVRLLAGVGAWALGLLGAAGLVLAAWSGISIGWRILGLAAGGVLLAAAVLLGRQVWEAGRRVVDAFVWWQLLPTRVSGGLPPQLRSSGLEDAVAARIFMLQGARMVRTIAAALAFLAPLAFLLFATEDSPRFDALWPAGRGGELLLAMLLVLAVSWTAAAITFGGQLRANWAHSQRDPVQSKIFATTGKLFRR
jgi:hypothetical protein